VRPLGNFMTGASVSVRNLDGREKDHVRRLFLVRFARAAVGGLERVEPRDESEAHEGGPRESEARARGVEPGDQRGAGSEKYVVVGGRGFGHLAKISFL
jgi:hypothetical protein